MSLISWLGGAVRNVEQAVGGAVNGAEQAVNNNVIHPAQQAVQQAVQHPQQAIQQAVRPVAQAINPMFPAAFDAGKFVINHAPQIANTALQIPNNAVNLQKGIAKGVTNTAVGIPVSAFNTVKTAGTAISQGLPVVGQVAQNQQFANQQLKAIDAADQSAQNDYKAGKINQGRLSQLLASNANDRQRVTGSLQNQASQYIAPKTAAAALVNTGALPFVGALKGGGGVANKVVQAGMGLGFGAQGLSQTPQMVKAIQTAKTPQDKAAAVTQLAANTLLSGAGVAIGAHGTVGLGKDALNAPHINNEVGAIGKNITPTSPLPEGAKTPFDTPEIIAARKQAEAMPSTAAINTPERQALRQQLADTNYGQGAANKNKRLDIVLGPPAAGKSSNLVEPLAKKYGSVVLDSDAIKEQLPEFNNGIGAGATHAESAHIADYLMSKKAMRNGDNIVAPRLGKNPEAIKGYMELAKEHGYDVHVHHVTLPPEQAAARAVSRFQETGRFVDPHYILNGVDNKTDMTYNMIKKEAKTYGQHSTDVPFGQPAKPIEASPGYEQPLGSGRAQHPIGNTSTAGTPSGKASQEKVKPPIERGFSKTVRTSPNTSPELAKLTNSTYDAPRSTKQLQESAQALIKRDIEAAKEHALSGTDDHAVATAAELIKHYDKTGDYNQANAIEQQASINLTEHGRAIQAATLYNKLAPDSIVRHTNNLLKAAGKGEIDPKRAEELIAKSKQVQELPPGVDKVNALNDLKKAVAKEIPASLKDKIIGLWRTGLLTGPQTVTKVMVSHAVQNAIEFANRVPATALDKILSLGTGVRGQTLTASRYGSGIVRGTKASVKLLTTGEETPMTSGLSGNIGEIAHQGVNYGNSLPGKVAQKYSDTVGHVHGAMPKPYYAAVYDNAIVNFAKAKGLTQGLKGADLRTFVEEQKANPSQEVQDAAKHDAEMATFQQKTKIGEAASGMQQKTGIVGKVAAPFTRIPSAIATDVINYSPAGWIKTSVEALKDKGSEGWTPAVQRRFVQGMSRPVTAGVPVLTLGAALYASGNLALSYPADQKTRALWAAEGKQANSIKLFGKWRQLSSLGPMGNLLAMGGYAAEAGSSNAKGASQLAAGVFGGMKSLADQTYLQGISGIAGAVNDPERSFNTYVKNQAASIIPTGLGTVARAFDPLQRQTNNPAQAIEAKVPGLREGLNAKQDAFGNPLQRAGGVATNLLDPSRPSGPNPGTNPALLQELQRLSGTGNTVFPDMSKDKTIGSGPNAVKLTPSQADARRSAEGPLVASAYQSVISRPGYNALSDANKAKALTNAMTDVQSVQAVKTLEQVAPDKAQAAYDGLTNNQKAMYSGSPSAKDYTALDSNGKALKVAKVPRAPRARVSRGGSRRARASSSRVPGLTKQVASTMSMNKLIRSQSIKAPKVAKAKTVKLAHIPKLRLPKVGGVKGVPSGRIAVSPTPRKSKTGSLLA